MRLAFDEKNLRKTLSKISHCKSKLEEKEARKARKRNYKESLLVCDEQIGKHSEQSKEENNLPFATLSHNNDKIYDDRCEVNLEYSENADWKSVISKHSDAHLNDNSKSSKWGTPLPNKRFKHDMTFLNSRKNLLYESFDHKSSYEISCSDERLHIENESPLIKNFMSPDNIIGNHSESEDINHTPLRENFKDFSNINNSYFNWKYPILQKLKNTPNINDFIKNIHNKISPQRDSDAVNDSSDKEYHDNFASPKKELSFGKNFISSTPVSKTPKQTYTTPCHPNDLLDDENTKAEFSNLFSSKSNHFSNL